MKVIIWLQKTKQLKEHEETKNSKQSKRPKSQTHSLKWDQNWQKVYHFF